MVTLEAEKADAQWTLLGVKLNVKAREGESIAAPTTDFRQQRSATCSQPVSQSVSAIARVIYQARLDCVIVHGVDLALYWNFFRRSDDAASPSTYDTY